MSQPTPYTPTTDFSQDEANNLSGRSTVRTANLDAEFANIGTTLGQMLANLALLQRDDGRLKDLACELHTLSPEVLNLMGGFNLRGLWQASTAYKVNDIVSNEAYTYCCTADHTSGGSFDGQYWIQFGFSSGADAAQAAAAAQVSASSASTSAGTATTQAGIATTQAGIATMQAGNAATSANTATIQAGAASVSAVNAANSANAAQAAAANLPNATTTGGDKFLKTNAGGSAWEYLSGAQAAAAIGGANLAAAIGATAVTNATNVTGAATSSFALTADITPAQITANTNDYAPTGLATANTLRLSTDASRDLTGLTGGSDGRLMIVHNVGSNALVLKNESASSTAANRFALGGADVTLAANQSVTLQYDATSSRWRSVSASGESASSILTKLQTVDGASSGLDADLLDGQHASAFAASGHTHSGYVSTDVGVGAVGTIALMIVASGSVGAGGTAAGSVLRYAMFESGIGGVQQGDLAAGTWRNLNPASTISQLWAGLMQRIS